MATIATSALIKGEQIDQFGYKITLVKRTNGVSTEVGFNTYVRHFKIFESLFSKFTYIEGLILDGMNVTQRFGIQPGDLFRVDIFKDPSDIAPHERIQKDFVIEHLGGQERSTGNKAAKFTFRAVSETGHRGLKNKVKKSFRGKGSAIVSAIRSQYLDPTMKMESIGSFGNMRCVIPSLTPFEAIENISKQCMSGSNPTDGNYFFYEVRDTVYFKPLKAIVAAANNHKYVLAADKNRAPDLQAANDYFRIIEFQHHESTDQRNYLQNGTLSNKVLTFDFITREIKTTGFSILALKEDILLMGQHLLMDSQEVDHFVTKQGQPGTDEVTSLFVRCSNRSYLEKPKDENTIFCSEEFIEKVRPFAQAQRGLMNQTVLTISILGNPRIKPGDTVEIEMAQASGDFVDEKDFVLHGKFLVGSSAHSITDMDNYTTILELFKDGYERDISVYRKDINNLNEFSRENLK